MWTLQKKTVQHRGGREKKHYSVTVAAAAWPASGDSAKRREMCERAYLSAVGDATVGAVAVRPAHVHVVILSRAMASAPTRMSIPASAIPDMRQWLFVVETADTQRGFVCAGGISAARLKQLALITDGVYQIQRCLLDPEGFYDTTELERETSLPGIPGSLATSHDSVMSMSSNGEGGAPASAAEDASAPLRDYAGVSAPAGMSRLCTYVGAHSSLPDLLAHRYDDHKNVARFVLANHGLTPARVAAHGGSANQTHEAAAIGLIDGVGDPRDPRMQHAAHMVSHWLVREHVLPRMEPTQPSYRWFVEQECRLVVLHTRFAFPANNDAQALAAYLDPVVRHYALRHTPTPPPSHASSGSSVWFTLGAVDALLLNLPSLRHGARSTYIDPRTHEMYFSAAQVADDLLPCYIAECVRGGIPSATPPAFSLDDQDTRDGTEPDTDLARVAERIVNDRTERATGNAEGMYLPHKDVDVSTLPHLNNPTFAPNLMPLCTQRLMRKLHDTGHLKFGERYALSNFLLDMGYDAAAITEHVRYHFIARGGTTPDVFDSSYKSFTYRKEAGLWEEGVRTIPYDHTCARKIDGRDLQGDVAPTDPKMCIGCPWSRLRSDTLRAELRSSAVLESTDIEDMVGTATVGANPSGACAAHFKALFGHVPRYRGWHPRAPRAFTQEALAAIRR